MPDDEAQRYCDAAKTHRLVGWLVWTLLLVAIPWQCSRDICGSYRAEIIIVQCAYDIINDAALYQGHYVTEIVFACGRTCTRKLESQISTSS